MSKVKLLVGSVFFVVGVTFLGFAAWHYIDGQSLEASGKRTTGTVVALNRYTNNEGDTMYKPEVEFRDRSGQVQRIVSDVSSSSPTLSRGEQVDIIFDPESPEDAVIDTYMHRYFMPTVFGAMGSIFALVGGGFLLGIVRRKRTIRSLKSRGMRIQADFIRCYLNTSTKLNGRSPYVVTAQATHPITGKLASFESEPIWLDLTSELEGKKLTVLVDPDDPDDHYIDLSQWVHESERA